MRAKTRRSGFWESPGFSDCDKADGHVTDGLCSFMEIWLLRQVFSFIRKTGTIFHPVHDWCMNSYSQVYSRWPISWSNDKWISQEGESCYHCDYSNSPTHTHTHLETQITAWAEFPVSSWSPFTISSEEEKTKQWGRWKVTRSHAFQIHTDDETTVITHL